MTSNFFADILIKEICQRFSENAICVEKPAIYQEILKRFVNKLGAEKKVLAYDWDLIVREYLEEYNLTWTCEIEEFFKSEDLIKYTFLYKDVEVLEWLFQKGYEMAILTNGLHKYQDQVIKKLGLERFFMKIVMPNPENYKFIKPYPDIFKILSQEFQKPHIMIGDSLFFDIYGAKSVGYETIWIIRKIPKKYKELSIPERTAKINNNEKFLLKHIIRSAPFLELSQEKINFDEYKPDYIINNLYELKELF